MLVPITKMSRGFYTSNEVFLTAEPHLRYSGVQNNSQQKSKKTHRVLDIQPDRYN